MMTTAPELEPAQKADATSVFSYASLFEKPIVITIDGGSGSGKSTIAGFLAASSGLPLVDSGLWYRAIAIYSERLGIKDVKNEAQFAELTGHLQFKATDSKKMSCTFLDTRTSTLITYTNDELQSEPVGKRASDISKHSSVRELLNLQQKNLLKDGGITTGRRQGHEVAGPDFEARNPHLRSLRFFLEVDLNVAAARRAGQLHVDDTDVILNQLTVRNKQDSSRTTAPTYRPEEAKALGLIHIDHSEMTREELRRVVLERIREFQDRRA